MRMSVIARCAATPSTCDSANDGDGLDERRGADGERERQQQVRAAACRARRRSGTCELSGQDEPREAVHQHQRRGRARASVGASTSARAPRPRRGPCSRAVSSAVLTRPWSESESRAERHEPASWRKHVIVGDRAVGVAPGIERRAREVGGTNPERVPRDRPGDARVGRHSTRGR